MTTELCATCTSINNQNDIYKRIAEIKSCEGQYKSFKANLNENTAKIYFLVTNVKDFKFKHSTTEHIENTAVSY